MSTLYELLHNKTNKMMCAQRRLRSDWASVFPVCSVVVKGPLFLHMDSEDSGWTESLLGALIILLVLSCGGSYQFTHFSFVGSSVCAIWMSPFPI